MGMAAATNTSVPASRRNTRSSGDASVTTRFGARRKGNVMVSQNTTALNSVGLSREQMQRQFKKRQQEYAQEQSNRAAEAMRRARTRRR